MTTYHLSKLSAPSNMSMSPLDDVLKNTSCTLLIIQRAKPKCIVKDSERGISNATT